MWQDGEEAAGGGRGVKGARIRSASAADGSCSAIGRRAPEGFLPQRRIVALCTTLHITTVVIFVTAARCTVAPCLLLQRDRSEGAGGLPPAGRIVARCTFARCTLPRLHHVCYCSALHGCIMFVIAARSVGGHCETSCCRPVTARRAPPPRILPRHAMLGTPTRARAIPRPHQPPSRRRPPRLVQSYCNQKPSAASTSGRGRPGSYKYSQYGPALPSQMTSVPLQMRQGCAQRRPCLEYSQHKPALSQE
jgi:hypothetical protein